jgi:predicted TPR repeat methyltransferase
VKIRPTAQAAGAAMSGPKIRDTLVEAVTLLRDEKAEEAEPLLQRVLDADPRQADALHYLGVLRHTQNRNDEAVELIRASLVELPDNSGAWNNLGNVLLLAGRVPEAVEPYEQALRLAVNDQEAVLALNNLGSMHRRLQRPDLSETCMRQAIERMPDFADAWYNLSITLLQTGRVPEGLVAHARAVALWPEGLQPRHEVVRALMRLGELDRAAQLLRDWATSDPGNPVPVHMLAACEAGLGGQAPERASDAYVEEVFDSFAASFDAKLTMLGYRAPELVVGALHAAVGEPAGTLDVCDAGVGTGLCGRGLRPFARQLSGCDLSVGMMKQARALKLYDVLHKAELTYYLDTQPAAFDAVISADTLCYFGALEGVAAAAFKALRPGGWLVFTVEALAEGDTRPHLLQPHGRYAHGGEYVRSTLAAAGFGAVTLRSDTLRHEGGAPVHGWVASAQRPRMDS